MEQPLHDNAVQVAVLFERLGHVMEKVDNFGKKLDDQEINRAAATTEIETQIGKVEDRVAAVEKQINGFRWFIMGIAAGGGVLGGVVATAITQALGG